MAPNLPKFMVPACVLGSTARGNKSTLVGMPLPGRLAPAMRGVDRAEVGAEGVAADDRLDVVIAVAGNERADDGELVGQRGQLRKRAAEGDAGQSRGDLAGGAADLDGAVILGSNVSIWLGPPCRKRKMTDLSVSNGFSAAAVALAASRSVSDSPPRARPPMVRKARRSKGCPS